MTGNIISIAYFLVTVTLQTFFRSTSAVHDASTKWYEVNASYNDSKAMTEGYYFDNCKTTAIYFYIRSIISKFKTKINV